MESTNNYELLFDISATATPDFQKYTPMNVGEDQNLTMDTWYDLCSKFANNEALALDPTWSITAKFDKTDPVGQFIKAKEYEIGLGRTASARIINKLKGTNGKQIDFTCVFDGISGTYETETVLEISFDLKIHRGTTFTETDYSASV